MQEIKGTIENWSIGVLSPYHPPEFSRFCGWVDGKSKVFSDPVSYDEGMNILTNSSGSRYYLGEPDPKYLEQFPNAREEFLSKLDKG